MYNNYFGLSEAPFSIAPDPGYLFMSDGHREALAHLLYGIQSDGGFVLLTGEVGTGKTTVCRCLLEQVPENCDVAFVLNPKLTVIELLSTICDELHIAYPKEAQSIKTLVDCINHFLIESHAQGRKAVLIIDEAQNLSADVLEQMRLLTNLETNQRKLLQIIMIGQPELRDMLARPDLRQVSQRIVARYHLDHLSQPEVEAYVGHRLAVAGGKKDIFAPGFEATLYSLSRGIPRLINVLCDRALLGAYAQGISRVDRKTLLKAAKEVLGKENLPAAPSRFRWKPLFFGLAGLVLTVLITLGVFYSPPSVRQFFSMTREEAAHMAQSHRKSIPGTSAPTVEANEPPRKESASAPSLPQTPEGIMERIATQAKSLHESNAFQILFGLWGKGHDVGLPGAEPCQTAQEQGLACYASKGGLDDLTRLNRPAVVRLQTQDGIPFFVCVSSMEGKNVRISMRDEEASIPLEVLARWWRGEFQVLWQPPHGFSGLLRPGDRGAAPKWLWEHIGLWRGEPTAGAQGESYDDLLVEEVKRFQVATGLQPDGIAGPQTIISLEAALRGTAPTLVHRQEGE